RLGAAPDEHPGTGDGGPDECPTEGAAETALLLGLFVRNLLDLLEGLVRLPRRRVGGLFRPFLGDLRRVLHLGYDEGENVVNNLVVSNVNRPAALLRRLGDPRRGGLDRVAPGLVDLRPGPILGGL